MAKIEQWAESTKEIANELIALWDQDKKAGVYPGEAFEVAIEQLRCALASHAPSDEVIAGHKRSCALFGTTVKCTCGASEAAAHPIGRKVGHKALRWANGKLESFDPHPEIEHNDH